MRKVIHNDLEKCVGCNHCVRVCPVDEANIVREVEGKIIVEIDNEKCIVCSACQDACHHGSRYYEDDVERFFADLARGEKISMFAAPAVKTNFDEWGRVLTWLRSLGVEKIYDVSLGADICIWAHIRHIEKNASSPIISQPCPGIVGYILMHRAELAKNLSPVHSPMMCTAVYMRKYEGVTGKIAALSPCAAKTLEFENFGNVDYNVTIKHLYDYIEQNNITLPDTSSGFDHYDAGLGGLFPAPGGLKENIEHYLGKTFRIDTSEGWTVVYKALDEYARQPVEKLPAIFDVLNCADGCNAGTGCRHDRDIFGINTRMHGVRISNLSSEDKMRRLDKIFAGFDERLNINDFTTTYTPIPVKKIPLRPEQIEVAYLSLGKLDKESRHHDCGACGKDRCAQMAEQIARGVNIPENCAAYIKMRLADHAKDMLWDRIRADADAELFVDALEKISKSPEISDGDITAAAKMIAKEGCAAIDASAVLLWRFSEEKNALVCITAYDAITDKVIQKNDYDMSFDVDYVRRLLVERIVVSTDIDNFPATYLADNQDLCAMMDASILVNGKFYGAVSIEQAQCELYPRGRDWTKEEQNFTASLADIMAIAVVAANVKYANKLQEVLSEITKSPSLCAGILEDAAKMISEEGCRAIGVHRVSAWRTAESEEHFKCIACFNAVTGEHFLKEDYDLSGKQGYLHSLKTERLVVVNNVFEPDIFVDGRVDDNYPGIVAILAAPVRVGGKLAGFICFEQDKCDKYPRIREWTPEEQSFASSLSDFLIIASESAEREMAKNELNAAHQIIVSSINYASKIQGNLLPNTKVFVDAFSDYSVIWKPRDVVGGDIYWAKNFYNGTVLCVCDCTGHGTPGALLTMLVVSALESIVWPSNCHDTAQIVYQLDQRLSKALNVKADGNTNMEINDGCDLAVIFIAKDGSVKMSAGKINVFVCDGSEVVRYRGQSIFVGEGRLKSKDEIKIITIPANPNNKFYIPSDGLSDQIGGSSSKQFGYRVFEEIILKNHQETQAVISGKIWDAFEEYRGGKARRDDFELITFKPNTATAGTAI